MEPPLPTPKRQGEFFVELESGRGVAALLVAGFHCGLAPVLLGETEQRLNQLTDQHAVWQQIWNIHSVFVAGTGNPHPGVLFFFVLSGFVLTDSLLRGPGALAPAAGRFTLARFFRIYPAIAATIAVFCTLQYFTGLHLDPEGLKPAVILQNLLLLRASIDGAMWTLQVEFLALPLIFAAWVLQTRLGLWAVALFAGLLAVFSFWGPWINLFYDHPPSLTAYQVAFLVGVVAYHLGRGSFPGLSRRQTTITFLLALAFFLAIGFVIHKAWETLFKACAAGVVIALLAFAPPIKASAPLRWRPLRFVGRVSYSFYLLHPLSLTVIYKQPALLGRWIEAGIPRIGVLLGLWAASTAVILPLAWLMYRTVELPFIRLGKRLWQNASRGRAPVSTQK